VKNKNIRLAIILGCVGLAMLGVGYAFVPLYRIFCDFVGIPVPSVKVGEAGTYKPITEVSDRVVTVRFMANNTSDIPVTLEAVTKSIKVRLGKSTLTAYKANNPSSESIKGVAVHTIVPMGTFNDVIEEYVDLQQCFCFEEQIYPPNKEINLPLSFTITPDLPEGIHTITFGYTLYPAEE
jgi:cytochrome c oxidase assembly protein subunit 11